MCIRMFSITLSHFERITNFFCMIGATTIFRENNFIFNFVGLIMWARCTFEEGAKKTKC
jgi:hypothetical protein